LAGGVAGFVDGAGSFFSVGAFSVAGFIDDALGAGHFGADYVSSFVFNAFTFSTDNMAIVLD
jgi:hypothetical protein